MHLRFSFEVTPNANATTVRPPRFATLALITVAACSGSGGILGPNGLGGGLFACDTGTQIQLADPLQGPTVNNNYGRVTIVANGDTNQLYNSYQQWQLELTDSFNDFIPGEQLNLVPDPNGPHPYQSDFYYTANIPTLTAGRTWTVTLSLPIQNCSAAYVGSFST